MKALILREKVVEHLLQAHADVDWTSNTATTVSISFDSRNKLQKHARCVVCYQDPSLPETPQKDASKVKHRIKALRDGITTMDPTRFNRPMVYRMIRPLARLHDDYHVIDGVVLNSKTLEVSSKLSFVSVRRSGDFHTHLAVIDALK